MPDMDQKYCSRKLSFVAGLILFYYAESVSRMDSDNEQNAC